MFEIRGFENKNLESSQWITCDLKKQGILSCFWKSILLLSQQPCLDLQVELLLFDCGRQPVTSRHFCLKSFKKLSHHLNAQFFHSSSNMSVESMNV